MLRILLIGKGSFIGANFIKYSKYKQLFEVDVRDTKPENINLTGFDVIIHLAAVVHQSKKIPLSDYLRVNAELPVSMAKIAKNSGVPHFVFISSSKVYGKFKEGQEAWNEAAPCNPTDGYGYSKLRAEEELLKLNDERFCVSVLRTPMVYGEGVKANMLDLIRMVDKFPVIPLGNIRNKRSITYVENIVGYIDKIIELRQGGILIAKDKESPSIDELVRLISQSLGKRRFLVNPGKGLIYLLKFFVPHYHERLIGTSVLDNYRTTRLLDFEPEFSTKEGIDRTVNYYLNSKSI
ncbi:MAG: NAD-dependent epimerase/dehydratase family protein [Bacteroidales bacterium]